MIEIEMHGGLGDCFLHLHKTDAYDILMNGIEDVRIHINSHNPHVRELFDHHPARSKLRLHIIYPWSVEFLEATARAKVGLPVKVPNRPSRVPAPLQYYPSPEDLEILNELPERFLLTSLSASSDPRSLPESIYMPVISAAVKEGIPVVMIGRSYGKEFPRKEISLSGSGIINLVDKLTVPGSVLALRKAAAMVTCHSSMNIVGWFERKPQFLCYSESTRIAHFIKHDHWSFGANFPETDHMLFSQYSTSRFLAFLRKNFK
jgi:hypothetical protein